MQNTRWLAHLLLSLFLLLSCKTPAGTDPALSGLNLQNLQDKGSFVFQVDPSTRFKTDLKAFLDPLALELSQQLNSKFIAPKGNIRVAFQDCGQVNALYRTQDATIVMCHDLFISLAQKFSQNDTLDAFRFIFLHELAHAMIDQYELPILGREEDAADALATVFLIEEDGKSRAALLAGIKFLDSYSNGFSNNWADSHSLGPQRMFNLVCWTIGGQPEVLSNNLISALNNEALKSGRNCQAEYLKQESAYLRLLKPFMKS